jgi:putative redox protein
MIPHLSLVNTVNTGDFYSESKVRQFIINADEPITNQGTDLAPAPLDLLNASLASCTASYLRFQTTRRGIETGQILVKIKIRKDENDNLLFDRTIKFENTLNQEDISFLLDKVQYTPITKIIMQSQIIQTKFI